MKGKAAGIIAHNKVVYYDLPEIALKQMPSASKVGRNTNLQGFISRSDYRNKLMEDHFE